MTKLLPALVFIVVLILLVFFLPVFKIKNLEISQNKDCLSSQDVISKNKLQGRNILLFNTSPLEAGLKQNYGCIDALKISKKYPSTLKLEVKVKGPVAKIADTNFTITEEGVVSQEPTNGPSLFLGDRSHLKHGQKLNKPEVIFATRLAAVIVKSDFIASNLRILGPLTVAAYNREGVVVLFSPKKTAAEQVDSLQQILGKAKIDAIKIAKIDLRFEKPIIVYKENGQG